MSGFVNLTGYPGRIAQGVIDFSGTGEAGMKVTIGGVDYQEADTAAAASGVWTNGASAADSATSLAAAINGDTRAAGVALRIRGIVSAEGASVIVYGREADDLYNHAMSETSAVNCTVDTALAGGEDPKRRRVGLYRHTVTAQDVKADEVNVFLPFTPTEWDMFPIRGSTGLVKATTPTGLLTRQSSPARLRYQFAGATDPIAGDVMTFIAWE